ncbi:hypothetical protein OJAV_G00161210 [Oryzias javanicus]|uniref:V-SNARE coiled-coil homology domain-containing protein n=2 Tax=Oryzias TaxID=8089 RepID=A0A437CJ47_ORYJA|nr:hypothetical protein OJAV_G00161210 [Oryzias javanicus]
MQEEGKKWGNPDVQRRKEWSQHSRFSTVPQCRPAAPSDTESCSTAKCEGRQGWGGEGRGDCTAVPSPSEERRQQERRITAVTHSAVALCADKSTQRGGGMKKMSAPDAAPPAAAPGAPGAPGADGAPAGPPAPPNTSSNRRLQQTQAQVEEVVDIMRVNVDKVLERDQKLSELDDRADALQAGASQFESCAAKLKNKYWWKNCKMMIMMGIIGVIVVGIIFLYFFY